MLDSALRPVKDRALAPLVRTPLGRLHPTVISASAMVLSIWAAVAAWRGAPALAVGLWLLGRIGDGLDGLSARESDRTSDLGGLIDIVFDTVGYAAIPIGVAAGIGTTAAWVSAAVLLATFYLNSVSWGYLSALLEKRCRGSSATGQPTGAILPRGLIEGTETIAFFSIALAFPDAAIIVYWVMAAAVVVTAVERLHWAKRAAVVSQALEIGVPAEPNRSRRVWTQRIAIAVAWLAVLIAWWQYRTSSDLGAADVGQRFIDDVEAAWWGVAAYVAVYLARPIVLFPASVLTVVAGVLFGPWVGVAVVIVAANASAMIAYGIGRGLGQAAHTETDTTDASFARRWSRQLRDNSFETVLVMRLLFLPYDLVNYLSGVLRIRWLPFLAATALGSLPGTVSFVLIGASLERVDEGFGGIDRVAFGFGLAIFVASLAGARLLRRRMHVDTDLQRQRERS